MGCYVDMQKDGDYLAQEVTDKGYTYLTIKSAHKGAIVESRDCGEWVKVS